MSGVAVLDRYRLSGYERFGTLSDELDARGLLGPTRRTLTWAGVVLPALAVGMLWALPPWHPSARLAAAVITVCASAFWWTRRWPSHRVSCAFVVIATLATGGWALAVANPLLVALGFAASAPLGVYVELFHPRLTALYVTVLATATVVLVLTSAKPVTFADGVLPLLGGAAIVATGLMAGHLAAATLDVRRTGSHVDPATGLHRRHAFDAAVGTLIGARTRSNDLYLGLVALGADAPPDVGHRMRRAMARAVTQSTRRDAVVGHITSNIIVVADVFDCSDAASMAERLRGVAANATGLPVSVGATTIPLDGLAVIPPDRVVDGLAEQAIAALDAARLAGGDQLCHAPIRGVTPPL